MPIPTPFHERTSELCTSWAWKEWAGCLAVRSYDTCHEREYHALRQAAGLIDVSPLLKYEVRGPDAGALLAQVTVRDVRKLRVGRVTYLCWCDDDGKVVDDGTVTRLGERHFRLTANLPSLHWLESYATCYDVTVSDISESLAALAIQGPRSREIVVELAGPQIETLRFFRATPARIGGIDVVISRTGYTGDLGYELWIDRERALDVWDAAVAAGRPYRLEPAGLDAMDVTRVEAGFVLNGVDYFSAPECLIDSRKSTPVEIGLGRAVELERDPFVGQQALKRESREGATWALVGLEVDWDELEALFAEFGLPPNVPASAWRDPVPVFDARRRQVGQATSGAWSPILKKNLALASVESACSELGTRLRIEVTVEYERRTVAATVVRTPFFDPSRKRAR